MRKSDFVKGLYNVSLDIYTPFEDFTLLPIPMEVTFFYDQYDIREPHLRMLWTDKRIQASHGTCLHPTGVLSFQRPLDLCDHIVLHPNQFNASCL
jgi:hypothetical protein